MPTPNDCVRWGWINPKRWSVVCWVLVVLWMFPALGQFFPIDPEFPETSAIDGESGSRTFAVYDRGVTVGWPMGFLEIREVPGKPPLKAYFPFRGLFNCCVNFASVLSLIYLIQTCFPRFSVRVLLMGVSVVACLVAVGQLILATQSFYLTFAFMVFVYYFPLFAIGPALVWLRLRSKRIGSGWTADEQDGKIDSRFANGQR